MLSTSTLRLLGERDLVEVFDVLARNPVANTFVESRVRASGGRTWRLGGELWGYVEGGRLRALCYSGANVVPVEADEPALRTFADRMRRQGRRCSSIVGVADQVATLWQLLEPTWGPSREVREDQPLLVIDRQPDIEPDPLVRPVRPDEIDLVLPACIAMFTEEVGVSPLAHDGGSLYRTRVAELIAAGRAFARIEEGRVVFKAEVGATTPSACQVQGVWVDPARRGEGLAAPGMAAVVEQARSTLAPAVSLYVNAFNVPARRAYDRVGFTQAGTFTTVLF
ncbi:MAG: GNAT family N-acetyltransferase [Actinomycetes bacterium]